MKRINPWSFGILLIIAFAYLAWNNFELPTFFFGKTETIKGRIYDIKTDRVPGGFVQILKYAYKVDGKWYFDKKRTSRKDGKQYVGNALKIEYSVKNPSKNSFEKLPYDNKESFRNVFRHTKKVMYNEIVLTNNMFRFRDYKLGEKINEEYFGEFGFVGDTMLLTPYVDDEKLHDYKSYMYLLVVDSLDNNTLLHLSTNSVYKEY